MLESWLLFLKHHLIVNIRGKKKIKLLYEITPRPNISSFLQLVASTTFCDGIAQPVGDVDLILSWIITNNITIFL